MEAVGRGGPGRASIAGVILAGGLSRRMGGGDKGLLELGGRPMLSHILGRLAPQVAGIAINANGPPERFAAFGCPVLPDTIEGFAGPLAGILAGMRWAAARTPAATHIVTVPGDAPLLPHDLVTRLAVAAGENGLAVARSETGVHPVVGLWPVNRADDLEAALHSGIRKVRQWADEQGAVAVGFDKIALGEQQVDPFYNANTPEDLEALRVLFGKVRQ